MQMAMKSLFLCLALFATGEVDATSAKHAQELQGKVDPIQKIIQLITELQGKLVRDGETEAKAYSEFFEWCDDASKEKTFELKTLNSKAEKLKAIIDKATSDISEASSHIEGLTGSIATDEADLKAATLIRKREQTEFEAAQKELTEAIDMLGRAASVLERELKGGASFLQGKVDTANLAGLLQTLDTVIDAASFSTQDKRKLLALVQSSQSSESDDDEDELGAPAPKAYESKSGGIVDVLQDMKEKAEGQLSDARKAETNSKHNYDMLKQSLVDSVAAQNHEMEETKANKAEAEEALAVAGGDLEVTQTAVAAAEKDLQIIQTDCMSKATEHEITLQGRKDELAALAKAKKIIQAATALVQNAPPSLLQIASSSRTIAGPRVLGLVKTLARDAHSAALTQLAARIQSVLRYSTRSGEDPFKKVKSMISDMVAKLVKEAEEEAGEKAYCDEEMSKTKQKKNELQDTLEKLTAKIDNAASASSRLKDEVSQLQNELFELAQSKKDQDKAREDGHAAFLASTGDLEKGLEGIRTALKVLREYYAKEEESSEALLQSDDGEQKFDAFMQQPAPPEKHEKSSGAGSGIIGLLEVAESDFAKNLAEEQAEEAASQEDYEKMTHEDDVTRAAKEQDVKYKTKEFKSLDASLAELSSDREGAQTEQDAVLEYWDKIKERCVAKPESYEERKKRREHEIQGLKEALSILEGEASAFFQQRSVHLH